MRNGIYVWRGPRNIWLDKSITILKAAIDLWSAQLTVRRGSGNCAADKMQTCWLNICWKPCWWPLMKVNPMWPCVLAVFWDMRWEITGWPNTSQLLEQEICLGRKCGQRSFFPQVLSITGPKRVGCLLGDCEIMIVAVVNLPKSLRKNFFSKLTPSSTQRKAARIFSFLHLPPCLT